MSTDIDLLFTSVKIKKEFFMKKEFKIDYNFYVLNRMNFILIFFVILTTSIVAIINSFIFFKSNVDFSIVFPISLKFLIFINVIGLIGYLIYSYGAFLHINQLLYQNDYESKLYYGEEVFYKDGKYYSIESWTINKNNLNILFKVLN